MDYGIAVASEIMEALKCWPVTIDIRRVDDLSNLIVTFKADPTYDGLHGIIRALKLHPDGVFLGDKSATAYLVPDDIPLEQVTVARSGDNWEISIMYIPMADEPKKPARWTLVCPECGAHTIDDLLVDINKNVECLRCGEVFQLS